MRQIIALGGGGFSMEPDNLALDRYILRQSTKDKPKVCFLPTASGDADGYILNFYKAFSTLNCQPSYLSLFRLPSADLEGYILEKDILYVGGGNTRSLMALWREWGLDGFLRKAYEAGVILAGISAGANCWFEECTTDSVPGDLTILPCLGLLPGSFCPHYDGEKERQPAFHKMIREEKIKPGWAVTNSAAVHFVDEKPVNGICSRPEAKVYFVHAENGVIREDAIEMVHGDILSPPK